MATYRLTPAARKDPEGIWAYTVERRGVESTLDYIDGIEAACDRLVAMPLMCRERHEYSPPVRIHPCREHLVVYVRDGDDISVVRVLHSRMDVDAQLSSD